MEPLGVGVLEEQLKVVPHVNTIHTTQHDMTAAGFNRYQSSLPKGRVAKG
jgi:hypothetical protein